MRRINPSAFRVARRGTSREINRQIALNLVREKQPVSRADLARAMDVRRGAVTLIVNDLLREGLIFEGATGETVRGRKGGIRLGRPATDITLLDTIKLTEENFAMAECFDGGSDVSCPLADNCDLNGALREALGAFFEVLDSYTIADLASKRKHLRDRLGLKLEELTEFTQH